MKKFIMMAVMAIVAISANAQDAGEYFVTPKINIGYANMTNDAKGAMIFGGGVEFEYMVADQFGLSAGVEFNYLNGDKESVSYPAQNYTHEEYYTMGMLNIPILAQYHIGGLALKAGIQPGFIVSPKAHIKDTVTGNADPKIEGMNSFQFGIPVGVSYTFGDALTVGANVTFPVTKMGKNSGDAEVDKYNFRCMPIYLSVGYRF